MVSFFDGDIHDSTEKLHKWAQEDSQPLIEANVKSHASYAFTCVRNPYTVYSRRFSTRFAAFSAMAAGIAATSCLS